ncbi:MAG TPA: hypothetical protein VK973_08265, partial [Arenicellales bacterium]|nr:hypothetical protein [Arenicellales bacterium]
EWTRNLAESNPQMLKWAAIIAALAAALGPVIFAIGATISGIGGLLKGVALFVKAGPAFIAMAKGIGAAVSLMGGPITLLITALGALAVAWVTHGEEIQAFVSQWIERLDEAMGGRLSAIINGVVAVVRWFVQQFRFSFKAIGQLLTGDFAGAWATFKEGWTAGWNAIVGVVGRAVGAIGEWIKGKLGAIFDWLGGKIEAVKGYFKGLYEDVVGGSFIPDMVDGILREMGRLEDGFVKPADEATKKVGQSFGSLKDQVKNVFQEILDTGEVSTQSLLKLAASAAAQIFDIQGLFKGSPGGGGDSTGQILSTIFSAASGGGGFGGFMADGGLAMAGRPYIVGERGPELFRPHTSGTVEPNTGGAGGVTQVFNIQTPDANSFRRSERQIMRSARQKLQMGS